jgi:chromosome partitioning protein
MEHAFPSRAPRRRTPWNTLSARVISMVSRKGGVGKTTSAVNLGAALALSGHTVLVVGVDPQCGVSRTLGRGPDNLHGGLLDLFDLDIPLTDLANPSALKELFFVSPRVGDLADEERFVSLMHERGDTFVEQIDRARNLYDTILIDCPPHLGSPTRTALRASDSVLVPVQAEELCRDSVGALLDALESVASLAGMPLAGGPELEGIFLTMLNERTRMGRHVAAKVAEEFGPLLMETAVPRTTRLSEMALRGKPSVIYDRRSPGSRAYFNLADEVMHRYFLREGVVEPAVAADIENQLAAEAAAGGDLQVARPAPSRAQGGFSLAENLENLLNDLRQRGSLHVPSAPGPDDFVDDMDLDGGDDDGPEMVSLDDLLAEEESGDDRWDESWRGDMYGDRVN